MIVRKISINILGREEISYGFELMLTKGGEIVWHEELYPSTYGAPNTIEYYPDIDADEFAFRSFDTEVASRYGHYVEITYDSQTEKLAVLDTPSHQWSDWQVLTLVRPEVKKAAPLLLLALPIISLMVR